MTKPHTIGGPSARPRGIDVALAVARERMGEASLAHALAFIDYVKDDVAPPRALAIFARMQHLGENEFRSLRNAVLASYGAKPDQPTGAPPGIFVAINGDVEWDVTASLVNRVRRRLEGRKNYRLRKRVELFHGHVEMQLLDIHVSTVCAIAELFDADAPVADIVRTYMEALELRRSLFHSIYNRALDRLHHALLEQGSENQEAPPPEPEPATLPLQPALRMLSGGARHSS